MRIAVFDTETTGLEEHDQVIELAVVTLEYCWGGWRGVGRYTTLIRPTVPVSVGARATHHITDDELAGAPRVDILKGALGPLFLSIGGLEVVAAAHNLAFDERMMTQSGLGALMTQRLICTYRCALHLWPDAPGHSNQVLRYHLGVGVPPVSGPPHRALPDAVVTAAILIKMLEQKSVDELVAMTKTPVVLHRVRFGKHRDRLWKDLDDGYLKWVLKEDFGPDEKHTARHWLDQRYPTLAGGRAP